MKRFYILLMVSCVLIACDDITVEYSYTPSSPHAGEVVRFTNLSTDGEEWLWSFGDGTTSTLKSPTHTYKQAGTYSVVLQVNNKKSLTCVQRIEVQDTIPDFTCEAVDGIGLFSDLLFKAKVYNPYNYAISYDWSVITNVPYHQLSGTNQFAYYGLYFEQAAPEAVVQLRLIINNDTTYIQHAYTIADVSAPSVLMRTADHDYQQRVYGSRFEATKLLNYQEGKDLLNKEQDTLQVYNGRTFRLSELKQLVPDIEGFKIASMKIYYRTSKGLYVANIDGSNSVMIDAEAISSLTIDHNKQRLYWSNTNGVFYMPWVGSANNHFVATPTQLNNLVGVKTIAIDNTLR